MKSIKKKLAAVLACAMAFSMASVVYAADYPVKDGKTTGEQEADVTVSMQGATYEFVVPTSLSVGLDAFSAADSTGSQVYSPTTTLINKSNVPLLITIKGGIKPGSGVAVKTAAKDVKISDPNYTTKEAYFEIAGMQGEYSVDRDGNESYVEKTDAKLTYDAEKGALTDAKGVLTDITSSLANPPVLATFALDKATYATSRETNKPEFSALAENGKGVGSFRFMGSLNPGADWKADDTTKDVEVKIVYKVSGMSSSMYDALTEATDADVQKTNMIVYQPTVDATSDLTFTLDSSNSNAVVSNKAGKVVFTDFGEWPTDVAVTGVKVSYDASTPVNDQALVTGDYTWTDGTKTLALVDTGTNVGNFKNATGDVTLTITFESPTEKKIDGTTPKGGTMKVVLKRVVA